VTDPKSVPRPAAIATPIPLPRPSEPPRPRLEPKSSSGEPSSNGEPLSVSAGEIVGGDPSKNASGTPAQTAEHYFNQGRARYEHKEYHAAVHLLREAVKLDASKSTYHFHLGIALLRNPRTRREADEHLQRAAELEPYNPQIRIKLGMLYKEVGLPKKAEAFFRAALQMDPDNRTARKEVGSHTTKAPQESIWKQDFGSLAKKIFKK